MSKSKELIKQQKLWYKKLKMEGFKDLETFDSEMEPNCGEIDRSATNHTIKLQGRTSILETEEFYRRAGHFLYDHEFKDQLEYRAWEMYSGGMPYRKVAAEIGKTYYKTRTILTELTEAMKERYSRPQGEEEVEE